MRLYCAYEIYSLVYKMVDMTAAGKNILRLSEYDNICMKFESYGN